MVARARRSWGDAGGWSGAARRGRDRLQPEPARLARRDADRARKLVPGLLTEPRLAGEPQRPAIARPSSLATREGPVVGAEGTRSPPRRGRRKMDGGLGRI